jgi:hypothetical protein
VARRFRRVKRSPTGFVFQQPHHVLRATLQTVFGLGCFVVGEKNFGPRVATFSMQVLQATCQDLDVARESDVCIIR